MSPTSQRHYAHSPNMIAFSVVVCYAGNIFALRNMLPDRGFGLFHCAIARLDAGAFAEDSSDTATSTATSLT